MIRIASLNANGLRAAIKKGFFDWMVSNNIDIVCIQEIRIQSKDIKDSMRKVGELKGFFFPAEKPGYSGVAIYSRFKPKKIVSGFGINDIDSEGRFIRIDFENLSIGSLYAPSGSSSEKRLEIKFSFMERVMPKLKQLAKATKPIVICGDWNVAHEKIDLKNWRSNQKNSGFLPEERAWFSDILQKFGYVDVFRKLDPRPEQYTWWSNRGQAWKNNVGWRIDYQLATKEIAEKADSAHIFKAQRFSDHAPLVIDYDFKINSKIE